MKTAAIYARVSSDKQREENTIASQTSALIAFAREQNCDVPTEWVIEDDGYSGASLLRPGLERLRDLAAEGLIQAVLIYAPDRLSRRYAYQILLIEEFARAGVEVLFIRSKRATTPEDELLLQFQGMIAEYERAQILERSRRGKRHRARQGQISVLAGAPYGYRYRRKTDHSAAYYEIDEEQARIVRWAYELYTVQNLSIGAVTRRLNERQIPTAKGTGRWERSTVWAMLRNPAYIGKACFGKTGPRRVSASRGRCDCAAASRRATAPVMSFRAPSGSRSPCRRSSAKRPTPWPRSACSPTRSTRRAARLRQRRARLGELRQVRLRSLSDVHKVERPNHLLLSLPRFGRLAPARRTGLRLSPSSSGFAGRSGMERNRALARRASLIQEELDRRLEAARKADPTQRREEALRRDLARCRKSIERLLTAYQESLLSLEELRNRMPDLRGREQACLAELQAIEDQSKEREICLRLAESVTDFLGRLRSSAQTLDVGERQRVLRLLVKEILVGDDKILIRHSIPLPSNPPGGRSSTPTKAPGKPAQPESYLLLYRA